MMKPAVRFHSTIVVLTVAVMYALLSALSKNLAGVAAGMPVLAILVAGASSLGFYRLLALVFTFLVGRSRWLMRWVLGPYFVRGTWVGYLFTKTGKRRIVIEHHDQTLEFLTIRGQSFSESQTLDATWFSHSAQIDPIKGLLHCFYAVNVRSKLYQVEGIGVLQFDRVRANEGPRRMTGYGLDTDAGYELSRSGGTEPAAASEHEYSGKLIFEEYRKVSDSLLPLREAKAQAFKEYGNEPK